MQIRNGKPGAGAKQGDSWSHGLRVLTWFPRVLMSIHGFLTVFLSRPEFSATELPGQLPGGALGLVLAGA